MTNDESLVQAALEAPDGDTQAFAELVRRHQATVLANCRHLTRAPEDAEDLAQEVFVKAFFKLASFEGRARFLTWLKRIKVNHCLNYLKSKRGRTFLDIADAALEAEPALGAPDRAGPALEREQLRVLIREVLDAMPDSLRVPLVMCDVDEMSYTEIQAELGLGLSATKMRIARARREFRDRWAARLQEGA
jgi:RNA polymerase sigma-70 factor (ECF subfamily)